MTAGLSFSEREALRDQYRQRAIAQAEKLGMTLRCQYLDYDLNDPGHQLCRGESPGGSGCLCRCHDNPGVAIVSRHEDRIPSAEFARTHPITR